jgi:hypothetical protein
VTLPLTLSLSVASRLTGLRLYERCVCKPHHQIRRWLTIGIPAISYSWTIRYTSRFKENERVSLRTRGCAAKRSSVWLEKARVAVDWGWWGLVASSLDQHTKLVYTRQTSRVDLSFLLCREQHERPLGYAGVHLRGERRRIIETARETCST